MDNTDSYLIGVSKSLIPRSYTGWDGLSAAERVFVCVWKLEAEINNGGFDQFYFNSAGEHAIETVSALEAIGAGYTADIVRSANARFGKAGPPQDGLARQNALEAVTGDDDEDEDKGEDDSDRSFDEFDSAFYEYTDRLGQLLYAYVMAHRREIRGA